MASVPPVYGDPDLNQRRKLPSMTNTGETGIGLHDPVNESLTGEPTNTGPMAPAPAETTGGTGQPPPQQSQTPTPAPQPTPAPSALGMPISANDWAGLGVTPAQATPGMPVPNQPGKILAHNGYAWEIRDAGQPATGPLTATTGGAQAGTGTEPPPAPPPTVKSAYQSALLKMLTENQENPTINDPALKGQADAFSLAQTRAKERARSALAERAAAEGGTGTSSGAFGNDLVGLEQAQGENEAGFNAGLVGSELQARRNQLLQAATLAGNQLTDEEHQALQRELANLDAQIRREGIAQQGALGQGDLALRGELGRGQLNLGLLGQLMQGEQFGKRLGADLGMFNASQNSNYLSSLLSQLGV